MRVASIVFMETLWVLLRRYRAPRKAVVRIARELLEHPRYEIENADQLGAVLKIYAASNIDFADAVALADARQVGCVLHAFDRRLAKLDDAALVV